MAIPPYTSFFQWGESWLPTIQASLDSYLFLFSDSLYINAYLSSLKIAIISTILTLIIGYAIAYSVAKGANTLERYLINAGNTSFLDFFLDSSICMDRHSKDGRLIKLSFDINWDYRQTTYNNEYRPCGLHWYCLFLLTVL